MKNVFYLLVFFQILMHSFQASAQVPIPKRVVTTPTAGTLPHKSFLMETHLYDSGGVTFSFDVGVMNSMNLGVSYGGSDVIGSSRVNWQRRPGFQASIRVLEESMRAPGISMGYDSQGDGAYISDIRCFEIKSRGFYLVMSRNYNLEGDFGIHAGINRSRESGDGNRDVSFWTGMNKTIGANMEIVAEYDFATNKGRAGNMRLEEGYLNAGVKLHFGKIMFELDLKNLLNTDVLSVSGALVSPSAPSREIRIGYRDFI